MVGLKRLLSYARRACDDYNMIEQNEKVAVALSGGKDSALMLAALANLSKFHPNQDSGFDNAYPRFLLSIPKQAIASTAPWLYIFVL